MQLKNTVTLHLEDKNCLFFFHSKNEPIFAVSMSNCNIGKSPLGSNHKT